MRAVARNWRADFGIQAWQSPAFFASKQDVDNARKRPPQAHALRRAFDRLKLDGIVCLEHAPTVYFRELPEADPAIERELLRLFWNQGLAPILVLVTDTEARIHTSLARPCHDPAFSEGKGSLVSVLKRATDASEIRQFILSVQSGDFFRAHCHAFDRNQRVDRALHSDLRAMRDELDKVTVPTTDSVVLDALLCRLVFTCYLFDRAIVDRPYLAEAGIRNAEHMRGILNRPSWMEAKRDLYTLFAQLGRDFNGDLFSDDLEREASFITREHIRIINRFFRGTDVHSGQQSLLPPYDFGVIPIETISAIYEHFLEVADKKTRKSSGAFYTPRFLAEMMLDIALEGLPSLLNQRYLDPACGSGIFLVALFNRLAEEWSQRNPNAGYDLQVKGLTDLLTSSLFGVDKNPTACRITAFSLYVAFLDRLTPPDIRKVLQKTKMLPPLVSDVSDGRTAIRCGDFFNWDSDAQERFDLVIGNPPWKSETDCDAPMVRWCAERRLPMPDTQKALAFAWKAPQHLLDNGRCCLVLPHGVLFNHGTTALDFQREWLSSHHVELVLNLADFRRFLFEEAINPALVIRFIKPSPEKNATIRYLAPKTDWSVFQAELVMIYPQDQTRINLQEVLGDLRAGTFPSAWKERFWGTPRDWKLLDRLRSFPTLCDIIRGRGARWCIAQGFQKPGPVDASEVPKSLNLPTLNLVESRFRHFRLFLLESDCETLPSKHLTVRQRSNTKVEVYCGPHVLITDGFKSAYAPFDAAFHQSVRGIHGPKSDAKLLVFLSAYLNSSLARYYLFHTSANWGIERPKPEAGDVLRLPFLLPEKNTRPKRAEDLIEQSYRLYQETARKVAANESNREEMVKHCVANLTSLVYEYFDIDPIERILIEDTNDILMDSAQPIRATENIPTLRASTPQVREQYEKLLSETLNDWAAGGPCEIRGRILASDESGLGVVILNKRRRGATTLIESPDEEVFSLLDRLERAHRKQLGMISIVRGVKVFDRDYLYLVKPLSLRFWTRTAALNDADSIAASVLSQRGRQTL